MIRFLIKMGGVAGVALFVAGLCIMKKRSISYRAESLSSQPKKPMPEFPPTSAFVFVRGWVYQLLPAAVIQGPHTHTQAPPGSVKHLGGLRVVQ